MQIDPTQADVVTVYRALVDVVNPRPIAWVTSTDAEGRVNLAPYSFFNVFGSNPPVVIFSPTTTRHGGKKDTLRNIEATGEFVVNLAVDSTVDAVNLTSSELPHGESEAAFAGLDLLPSESVRPPRVAASPVHLECRLRQILPVGDGPLAANLVIGEVLRIHIDDAMLGPDGRVDPRKLRTVGRMGGDFYCRTGELFELPRPQA